MALPADSARSRICWSAVALLIIIIWMIFLYGGATIPFNTSYTFPKIIQAMTLGELRMIWPGEFGHNLWLGLWLQFGPFLAIALWLLCLVRYRTRVQRVFVAASTLVFPAGLLLALPPIIITAPFTGFRMLLGAHDGESWEDNFAHISGMALWYWFMVPLIVLSLLRPTARDPHRCPACGYSTIGLPTERCPECGNRIPADG